MGWLPDEVDTLTLAQAAGIAINPGHEWGQGLWPPACGCDPSKQTIRDGVAALAAVCRRGPSRIANVERRAKG
jgi:hypothetical protein